MPFALPRLVRSRLLAALAAVLVALLLCSSALRRLFGNLFQLRSLRSELSTLKSEEGELRRRISEARQDERVIERAARHELGYLKPGEIEYRFPPPPAKSP